MDTQRTVTVNVKVNDKGLDRLNRKIAAMQRSLGGLSRNGLDGFSDRASASLASFQRQLSRTDRAIKSHIATVRSLNATMAGLNTLRAEASLRSLGQAAVGTSRDLAGLGQSVGRTRAAITGFAGSTGGATRAMGQLSASSQAATRSSQALARAYEQKREAVRNYRRELERAGRIERRASRRRRAPDATEVRRNFRGVRDFMDDAGFVPVQPLGGQNTRQNRGRYSTQGGSSHIGMGGASAAASGAASGALGAAAAALAGSAGALSRAAQALQSAASGLRAASVTSRPSDSRSVGAAIGGGKSVSSGFTLMPLSSRSKPYNLGEQSKAALGRIKSSVLAGDEAAALRALEALQKQERNPRRVAGVIADAFSRPRGEINTLTKARSAIQAGSERRSMKLNALGPDFLIEGFRSYARMFKDMMAPKDFPTRLKARNEIIQRNKIISAIRAKDPAGVRDVMDRVHGESRKRRVAYDVLTNRGLPLFVGPTGPQNPLAAPGASYQALMGAAKAGRTEQFSRREQLLGSVTSMMRPYAGESRYAANDPRRKQRDKLERLIRAGDAAGVRESFAKVRGEKQKIRMAYDLLRNGGNPLFVGARGPVNPISSGAQAQAALMSAATNRRSVDSRAMPTRQGVANAVRSVMDLPGRIRAAMREEARKAAFGPMRRAVRSEYDRMTQAGTSIPQAVRKNASGQTVTIPHSAQPARHQAALATQNVRRAMASYTPQPSLLGRGARAVGGGLSSGALLGLGVGAAIGKSVGGFLSRKILKPMGRNLTNFGPLLAFLGLGSIARFGYQTISQTEYAKKEADIYTQGDKAGVGKQLLEAQIRSMARNSPYALQDFYKAQRYLGMSGMSATTQTQAFQTVERLAIAMGTSMSVAADKVTNIASAIGGIDKLEAVADQIAAVVTRTNTDFLQFANAAKYALGTGTSLGFSVKDQIASIGLAGNVGLQGDIAGTGLRTFMARLISMPNKLKDRLYKAGADFYDLTRNAKGEVTGSTLNTKNMSSIFRTLMRIQQKDPDLISEAFRQRAGTFLLGIMEQLKVDPAAFSYLKLMQERSAGTLQEKTQPLRDTLQMEMNRMVASFRELAVTLGEGGLNSGLRSLFKAVGSATDGITAFVSRVTGLENTKVGKTTQENEIRLKAARERRAAEQRRLDSMGMFDFSGRSNAKAIIAREDKIIEKLLKARKELGSLEEQDYMKRLRARKAFLGSGANVLGPYLEKPMTSKEKAQEIIAIEREEKLAKMGIMGTTLKERFDKFKEVRSSLNEKIAILKNRYDLMKANPNADKKEVEKAKKLFEDVRAELEGVIEQWTKTYGPRDPGEQPLRSIEDARRQAMKARNRVGPIVDLATQEELLKIKARMDEKEKRFKETNALIGRGRLDKQLEDLRKNFKGPPDKMERIAKEIRQAPAKLQQQKEGLIQEYINKESKLLSAVPEGNRKEYLQQKRKYAIEQIATWNKDMASETDPVQRRFGGMAIDAWKAVLGLFNEKLGLPKGNMDTNITKEKADAASESLLKKTAAVSEGANAIGASLQQAKAGVDSGGQALASAIMAVANQIAGIQIPQGPNPYRGPQVGPNSPAQGPNPGMSI